MVLLLGHTFTFLLFLDSDYYFILFYLLFFALCVLKDTCNTGVALCSSTVVEKASSTAIGVTL